MHVLQLTAQTRLTFITLSLISSWDCRPAGQPEVIRQPGWPHGSQQREVTSTGSFQFCPFILELTWILHFGLGFGIGFGIGFLLSSKWGLKPKQDWWYICVSMTTEHVLALSLALQKAKKAIIFQKLFS